MAELNKDLHPALVREKKAVTVMSEATTMAVNAIKERMNLITTVYSNIMDSGIDYGTIPGCGDKPTLLKSGAEKLMMAFRIAAQAEKVEISDLGNNHRDYRVTVSLTGPGGEIMGGGVGSCSTMESKYRYRNIADYELTGLPIPKDSKEKKQEYRRAGFGMKKVDGVWEWVKYLDAVKSENPDPADQWNTCLKMAKKRALIDACLTSLGASTMFTQDIEDMVSDAPAAAPASKSDPAENMKQREFEALVEKAKTATKSTQESFNKVIKDYKAFVDKGMNEMSEIDYGVLCDALRPLVGEVK